MYRYTDNALILCPSYECYENKEESYYRHMAKCLQNIVKLLQLKDITPCMLTSDEIACRENPSGVTWWQTMTPGDVVFTKKHCVGMNTPHSNVVQFADNYRKALEKYPMQQSKNTDILFGDVLKRTQRVERELIKTAKVVFNIQTANNAAYNVKPKAGSGIILVNIRNGSFIPTAYLGDMEINPIELLDFKNANQPVYEWRFE